MRRPRHQRVPRLRTNLLIEKKHPGRVGSTAGSRVPQVSILRIGWRTQSKLCCGTITADTSPSKPSDYQGAARLVAVVIRLTVGSESPTTQPERRTRTDGSRSYEYARHAIMKTLVQYSRPPAAPEGHPPTRHEEKQWLVTVCGS
jgi:hypothetical protein